MHESESEVAQSCLTLSDPKDCRLPGSSVHGIFQARVLEWVAIARQYNKKQRHYFANKGLSSQGYGFSSGCESWTVKKPSVEESMLLNCGVGEDS